MLDFSGATAEWTVENDIENLKVNRIVGATAKGTITGEKPIIFAANAGVSAVYESKVNVDNVCCPVVLETDLTMNHLNGSRAFRGNIRHSPRAEGRRPDGDGPCARPYRHRPIALRFQGN